MVYEVLIAGHSYRVELKRREPGYACRVDGREMALESVSAEREVLWLLVGGSSYEVRREAHGNGAMCLVAPMPGKVVRILKAEGDTVEPGEGVVVVEAMKMQNEIRSPRKGVVRKILAAAGTAVIAGEGLAVVE